jgi:hypothetical protein
MESSRRRGSYPNERTASPAADQRHLNSATPVDLHPDKQLTRAQPQRRRHPRPSSPRGQLRSQRLLSSPHSALQAASFSGLACAEDAGAAACASLGPRCTPAPPSRLSSGLASPPPASRRERSPQSLQASASAELGALTSTIGGFAVGSEQLMTRVARSAPPTALNRERMPASIALELSGAQPRRRRAPTGR